MVARSIANLDIFKLIDENQDCTYYGCNQEWYPEKEQRETGCGPTTACNILFYLKLTSEASQGKTDKSKQFGLSLMEEAWKYVTPAQNGITSTIKFCKYIHTYSKRKGLNLVCEHMDIPKDGYSRPDFGTILDFIEKALICNTPVAFLNLCNGEVKNLDRWHWTTIVALEYSEDFGKVYVEIVDGGQIHNVDFALWYKTTKLGGGLVRITMPDIASTESNLKMTVGL
ncbi:hypothetical protein [Sinanaerobacter chloroacetimidivorans]|uniref:Uncharacterized protein n=1 Tax=Sinanaerobacter chloroacetimidivorans TaxID=2818044 RepID=A0A8J7W187_9FIRM|nr:hypothetical protein [Sinanaerobacter chloroacetimidivorans]MBR0598566.1 hypothetical protein [Sinanaerobacter chloroacetimidivorans]